MKQSINSGTFIAIIAAVVVIAAAIIVWVYRAPPAAVAQASNPDSTSSGDSTSGKSRGASRTAEMREAHSGPTPEQRKQIEEWKRAHPDGYTRQ